MMAGPALLLPLAVVLGGAGLSLADTSRPETTQAAMEAFAKRHPQCRSLTDGCMICAIQGQVFTCSTPQTACVKKDYSCTQSQASDEAE